MRGKRAKQYRKLMYRYEHTFGFRPPYQILVDAELVQDAHKFKMDLGHLLKRTLQSEIKIMITQCSMRHLYASKDNSLIELAKTFERRRCNHHELEHPLSTLECFSSVVDPKSDSTNKHRYVVASQDQAVRAHLREIPGVPLLYISRSVMILEPISEAAESFVLKEERSKFRAGLKPKSRTTLGKRTRDGENDGNDGEEKPSREMPKKKRPNGTKGPNPLSVKKKMKRPSGKDIAEDASKRPMDTVEKQLKLNDESSPAVASEKKKRKRKSSKHVTDTGPAEPMQTELTV